MSQIGNGGVASSSLLQLSRWLLAAHLGRMTCQLWVNEQEPQARGCQPITSDASAVPNTRRVDNRKELIARRMES